MSSNQRRHLEALRQVGASFAHREDPDKLFCLAGEHAPPHQPKLNDAAGPHLVAVDFVGPFETRRPVNPAIASSGPLKVVRGAASRRPLAIQRWLINLRRKWRND